MRRASNNGACFHFYHFYITITATKMENRKEQKRKKGIKEEYRKSILLFLRFSGWIAGPIIIGALIGTWLDSKYGTSPWIFLTAIGIAFLVSMAGLIKEASREYERIEKKTPKKEEREKEGQNSEY